MDRDVLTFNLAARRPENGWFWIAGAFVVLLASYAVPHLTFIEDAKSWGYIVSFLAFLLLLVGVAILLIRQGLQLDRRSHVVRTWHGLSVFLKRRTVNFDEIRDVRLTKVVIRSKHSTVLHSVLLKGPEPHILVEQHKDYGDARASALRVANFLGRPLYDEAVAPVFQENGSPAPPKTPGSLDMSLQEQATASGESLSFPKKPGDCRINLTRVSDAYVFEMPPLRRSLAVPLAVALFSLMFAAGLGLLVESNVSPSDPLGARIALWSLPVAVALIGPTFALGRGLNRRIQREQVSITPLAISKTVRQQYTRRSDELPIALIEQIGYTPMAASWAHSPGGRQRENEPMPSAAIAVRTGYKQMYLGQGLRRTEQIWLHDALAFLLQHAGKDSPRQNTP